MIRFVFRFLGLICLALGFIFLVYDGTILIANHRFEPITVARIWQEVHQASLSALQAWVEKRAGPAPWQNVIQPYVLELPVWAALGIVGAILILLGRKRRKLIGYSRD
jgi:hypothetical protein